MKTAQILITDADRQARFRAACEEERIIILSETLIAPKAIEFEIEYIQEQQLFTLGSTFYYLLRS